MSKRIDPTLLSKIQKKKGIAQGAAYALIQKKVAETFLPRHVAAVALAAELGIGVSRYVDELAQIRGASPSAAAGVPSVQVPALSQRMRATKSKGKKTTAKSVADKRRGTSVFVVHGRNVELRKSLFSFLRAVGLVPLEWKKAIELTGKANPYIEEILDAAFREAAAVVVILSPDDEAKLRAEFLKGSDPQYEKTLTGQARPNVLFEAGMALGRDPNSTVIVQVGEVRPFSDIAGKHILQLDNSPEARSDFVTRLANAGCNVNAEGTDWYSEGNFAL